ncbi:MAG: class I SAM-dependent methyltransferase [Anaerolineae bacterium]|nr:class I SAM-dependent methyltransferase [Anaerolineae bacterium]
MSQFTYSEKFFKSQRDGSRTAAEVIVPLLIDWVQPASVIDIGCGAGGWLATFHEAGVQDIRGVDGSYVNRDLLFISPENFTEHDLRQPFTARRSYDLVVSLEVAEHLPLDSADTFVETLTNLGPVVLFSAAVPFQAGVNHLNEQWQDYWADKFRTRGYLAVDCIRKRVWNLPEVPFWYAQNTLLYVREDYLRTKPDLQREYEQTSQQQLAILHPQMLTDMGITRLLTLMKLFPFTIRRTINKRLLRR